MKDKFIKVPPILQKQVYTWLGFGLIAIIIFITIFIYYRNISYCLPFLLLSCVLLINGCILLQRFVSGNFLVIEGICSDVETTRVKKRITLLGFMIDNRYVRLPIHRKIQDVKAGDSVLIYLSSNTPVYEQTDVYTIYSYYALEIKREQSQKRKIINKFAENN